LIKIKKISTPLYDLPYLTLGIILIFIIYVISWFNETTNKPVVLTERVQKVLQRKQVECKIFLVKILKDRIVFNNGITTKTHQGYPGLNIPEGVSFQVYIKDSLVFWSDNTVPVYRDQGNNDFTQDYIKKLDNGWYCIQTVRKKDTIAHGLILLKHEYSFQNDYLKNQFQSDFNIPLGTTISLIRSNYPIFSKQGEFLFSLIFPIGNKNVEENNPQAIIIFLCFLTGILLILVYIYKLHVKYSTLFPGKNTFFISFTLDVFIIRLLQFYFQFPGPLIKTELFGPAYYSSSVYLPSLGDLVINAFLLVVISYVFYRKWPAKEPSGNTKLTKFTILVSTVLVLCCGIIGLTYFLYNFIINSSIPLNLQDVSNLKPISLYGLLVIWAVWTSFFLISWSLIQNLKFLFQAQHSPGPSAALIFTILIIISAITTIGSNFSNNYKEKEKRKILAIKLASTRNPVTEILFSQIEKKLLTDPKLTSLVTKEEISNSIGLDDSLNKIIKSHFLNDYWTKYNIQITLCTEKKSLQIQPQGYIVGCNDYFTENIKEFGKTTSTENLFFLDLGYGNENYLAVIPIIINEKNVPIIDAQIFIEINSKYIYKDLGYPELLIDHRLIDFPDISDYSCAFYQNNKLLHRIGKYAFCFDLKHYLNNSEALTFFNFDGMNHYHYRIDATNDLIISKKKENLLTTVSPFSYLFLFLGLTTILFIIVIRFKEVNQFSINSLRSRLQISTMSILLISFIIIGLIVIVNIIRLTADKNLDYLNEKTMSIFVEIQHKFGTSDNLETSETINLDNLLVKLSNVFFSDINIYDPNGQIIASSRPQVFDESLISRQINPVAYWNLRHEKSSIFIHKESIGDYSYSSAYVPFYNNHNILLGYINLPFFARQDDLKKEISSFLVAFINVYLLLILLGVLVAYLVSKYITAPLQLLANKIGHIKLGIVNERIDWTRKDEIGRLVEEYNRMVLALEESAEKLAQSEREGAWREMAKQVAHEIKNPLTPMKLSIQYLQKAWNEKAPDWDVRLEKFTGMLVEQIETLSAIASDFSDFAKMPLPENEKLNLTQVLESVLVIYQHLENIDLKTTFPLETAMVFGDRKQLIRVFTNLLNNSIEAIGKKSKGKILIQVKREGNRWLILITDSGGGVTPDQAEKIFQPYFTTKTGGMGLGLAIVKGILQGMNGNITFKSTPGKGTSFCVNLPVYHD